MPSEPPDADPHVRWCGGRRGEPGAYPIDLERARSGPPSGARIAGAQAVLLAEGSLGVRGSGRTRRFGAVHLREHDRAPVGVRQATNRPQLASCVGHSTRTSLSTASRSHASGSSTVKRTAVPPTPLPRERSRARRDSGRCNVERRAQPGRRQSRQSHPRRGEVGQGRPRRTPLQPKGQKRTRSGS